MIVSKRRDEPDLPRGNSSDAKPKMIELDRKIGQKSVISQAQLVDQAFHGKELIRDASAEGGNGLDQLFVATVSVNGAAAL